MQTIKIALRNLLRNKRRTLSTLCAITIGTIGILLFGGYIQSIGYSLKTTFIRDIGHFQIQHKDFLSYGTANPQEYIIKDHSSLLKKITDDSELNSLINVATPIILMNGIASNYYVGSSRPVLIYGTESNDQEKMIRWDEYDLGGALKSRKILDKEIPDAALLGRGQNKLLQISEIKPNEKTAVSEKSSHNPDNSLPDDIAALANDIQNKSDAKLKNDIDLLAITSRGLPNIVKIEVTGVQQQAAREIDDSFINVHLKQAQQLLFGKDNFGATAIAIQLHHSDQMDIAKEKLQEILSSIVDENLAVVDFIQLQPLYEQILGMFGTLFNFLLVIILCITLFTISNTMSMAVLERTIEIGTLRSIGLKRSDIQHLFLNEGILLGIMGSILGVFLALMFAQIINFVGLTWQPPGVIEPVPIRIKIWGEWKMIGSVILTLMFAVIISSWWPARRAANMPIVEALRYV